MKELKKRKNEEETIKVKKRKMRKDEPTEGTNMII